MQLLNGALTFVTSKGLGGLDRSDYEAFFPLSLYDLS